MRPLARVTICCVDRAALKASRACNLLSPRAISNLTFSSCFSLTIVQLKVASIQQMVAISPIDLVTKLQHLFVLVFCLFGVTNAMVLLAMAAETAVSVADNHPFRQLGSHKNEMPWEGSH